MPKRKGGRKPGPGTLRPNTPAPAPSPSTPQEALPRKVRCWGIGVKSGSQGSVR